MKPNPFVVALCLLSILTASAQTTRPAPEARSFTLTPVAPPVPALKYDLLFRRMIEKRPGNAAILYLYSILLMDPDSGEKADKALAARDAGDTAAFDARADSLQSQRLFDELDLAARRDDCDWQIPMRETGASTLLPQLRPLRDLLKVLEVCAIRQMEQGQIDQSLATLRLGYELADHLRQEPTLVAALVSLNGVGIMDNGLEALMNRPDSPNLYWALRTFPARQFYLQSTFETEGLAWLTNSDLLRKKWSGQELRPEEWRSALAQIVSLNKYDSSSSNAQFPDPIRDATGDNLQQARLDYAQAQHVSPDQAAAVDPAVLLGNYYMDQYQIAYDNMDKWLCTPYPVVLAHAAQTDALALQMQRDEPANPFFQFTAAWKRAIWHFARVDRQLAALTAVESIRSYAASHNGSLPSALDDVIDTPVPPNPATGKPFEYSASNGVATLSDTESEDPLNYTIKIRQ